MTKGKATIKKKGERERERREKPTLGGGMLIECFHEGAVDFDEIYEQVSGQHTCVIFWHPAVLILAFPSPFY